MNKFNFLSNSIVSIIASIGFLSLSINTKISAFTIDDFNAGNDIPNLVPEKQTCTSVVFPIFCSLDSKISNGNIVMGNIGDGDDTTLNGWQREIQSTLFNPTGVNDGVSTSICYTCEAGEMEVFNSANLGLFSFIYQGEETLDLSLYKSIKLDYFSEKDAEFTVTFFDTQAGTLSTLPFLLKGTGSFRSYVIDLPPADDFNYDGGYKNVNLIQIDLLGQLGTNARIDNIKLTSISEPRSVSGLIITGILHLILKRKNNI